MAATTRSQVATHNYRFSSFLGGIHASDPATMKVIAEAKAEVGEAEVKKGFTGTTGEGASARVIATLKEKGVQFVGLKGNLTSVRVRQVAVDGREQPYLVVGLRDNDGRDYLSVSMHEDAAQLLVRKLVNAEPGLETEYRLWSEYVQKEGKDRPYAEGCAFLRQRGVEVKGLPRSAELAALVTAATDALVAAGVPLADKETHGRRREKVTLDYHLDLMEKVVARFDAYYAAKKQSTQPSPHTGEVAEDASIDAEDTVPY